MLGWGIDLATVDRVRDLLARHGDRFRTRCFGPSELAQAAALSPDEEAHALAVAWAAKEAFLKAAGSGLGRTPPRQIELLQAPDGPPRLRLGPAATVALVAAGASRAHVTVARAGEVAAALVALD